MPSSWLMLLVATILYVSTRVIELKVDSHTSVLGSWKTTYLLVMPAEVFVGLGFALVGMRFPLSVRV